MTCVVLCGALKAFFSPLTYHAQVWVKCIVKLLVCKLSPKMHVLEEFFPSMYKH